MSTTQRITKYERARIIGRRAADFDNGAIPNVDVTGLTDTLKMAEKEFEEGKCPYVITRYISRVDGLVETIKVNNLLKE